MVRRQCFSTARVVGCLALLLGALPTSLNAFSLARESWTRNRTVLLQLSLGETRVLSDGSVSFNQVARDALNIWNQYLVYLRFEGAMNSPVPPLEYDDEMSVFFGDDVFGDAFGSGTLAVTLIGSRNGVTEETDTVFNNFYQWDSYRGALRAPEDLRRVALHEFGHVLGLNHPNDAGQQVSAIMNSNASNIDTLQPDDIAGAQALYGNGPARLSSIDAPVLRNISTRALLGSGENALIGGFIIQGSQPATVVVRGVGYSLRRLGITNALSDPTITIYNASQQVVATNDDWFTAGNAETIASYGLDPRNSLESALLLTLPPGAYTVVVNGLTVAGEPTDSGVAVFELYDLHSTDARAGNVSSRGQVRTGDDVLIGGFILGTGVGKEVIVRAMGPSLATAGVGQPLGDPTLSLHDANGTVLQANDDWQQGPNASTIAIRGFAPGDPKESAVLAMLGAGNYTAVVRGVNDAVGIGLVEVYDMSSPPQ